MNRYSFVLTWRLLYLVFAFSFCHSLLRQNCQVLERKYFATFMDLKLDICEDFEKFNSSIAVHCDRVTNLHVALKEAPLETDWLCLTNYEGDTVEAEDFSGFTNLRDLYITSNNVVLQNGTFSNLPQLTTLWIGTGSTNYNITFNVDTFYGLNSLQELKIFGIKISSFNISLFNHLHLLNHLKLEDNKIIHLSEVTASLGTFPNLKKLSITANSISELRRSDCFTSQVPSGYGNFIDFNISHLDLGRNKLSTIDPKSLCNFPHLELFAVEKSGIEPKNLYKSGIKTIKTISFQNNGLDTFEICAYASHFQAEELLIMFYSLNKINTVKGSCECLRRLNLLGNNLEKFGVKQMQKLYNLLELNLSNNDIESLNVCTNESKSAKLLYLNVSFNNLLRLEKRQFSCLNQLKSLSLENNKINHIEDSAFYGLDQLELLNLQNNNLFKIGEFTFKDLFLVRHLHLYGNTILTFDGFSFKDLVLLQDISVTYNFLIDLFWWQYIRSSVRSISIQANLLHLIEGDLDEFPFLESLLIDSSNIILSCSRFSEAKELHLKNVVQFLNTDAPWSTFANFTNLEKLYFSGNLNDLYNVSDILNSVKDIPSLKFFYMHDTDKVVKSNQINVNTIFQRLSQLKVLHLKNSGVDHLNSKDIFRDLHDLEFLVIENQNMQEVQSIVFDPMPNLKYIYFLETTFPCSCDFKGLLTWLKSDTHVSIINFHQQRCLINHISINFLFFLDNNCQSNLDFIMFVVSFSCTILLMCISLLYESIWWYILYIIYRIKCWWNHRLRPKDKYEYDVFVSYNTNNEAWVTEQLLPNLEQNGPPFFKVCIHNRDFQIGKDIVENIMDSIYNSRWTVSIITRSYLQSDWCSLEMRMATYRLLIESKDSFILIFLDKISKQELQHYHRLTKLLDKKTYLDWPDDENGQQVFWARLRKVISKSGRKLE